MLKISKDLSLPLDYATQTDAIIARKRVGKTYTASVIAEELIEHEIPIVVLDPTGAWWGLRSSADGKREGYKVIVIGGEHGDVPLEDTAGKIIADLVVDHPGYYVIDFSKFEHDSEIQRFATEFGKRFYFRKEEKRFAVKLIIDEADIVAPQNPMPNERVMLHTYDNIVRRGGIRGIGVCMITQRPAVLNKNILTQCETLFCLQISGSQDIDALMHWTKVHGTKEQKEELFSTIATLQRGEAWFWSPSWMQKFEKIHIRERRTFNSSATPKVGETVVIPKRLAAVDITKLGEQIRATVEHAKENDPQELRKTIAELRRDLKSAEGRVQTKETVKEVRVVTKDDEKVLDAAIQECQKAQTAADNMTRAIDSLKGECGKIAFRLEVLNKPQFAPRQELKRHNNAIIMPKERPKNDAHAENGISPVAQRILNALAELLALGIHRPVREIVALMANYTNLASTGFVKATSALRTEGYIDYPDAETMVLTDIGLRHAVQPSNPRSSEEIQNRICNILGGKSAEVLRPLIDAYPSPMSRMEVANRAGYTNLASTGFVKVISRLRTLGFVDYPDRNSIVATKILFLE